MSGGREADVVEECPRRGFCVTDEELDLSAVLFTEGKELKTSAVQLRKQVRTYLSSRITPDLRMAPTDHLALECHFAIRNLASASSNGQCRPRNARCRSVFRRVLLGCPVSVSAELQ